MMQDYNFKQAKENWGSPEVGVKLARRTQEMQENANVKQGSILREMENLEKNLAYLRESINRLNSKLHPVTIPATASNEKPVQEMLGSPLSIRLQRFNILVNEAATDLHQLADSIDI